MPPRLCSSRAFSSFLLYSSLSPRKGVNALRFRYTSLLIALMLLCPLLLATPYNPNIGPQIDAFLTSKSSPIAGDGMTFLQDGIMYNIDPRLIVAIAGAESSFGTNWVNCPANGFNAWSWFYNGNCPNSPFSSFNNGIDTVTRFMRRSYLNKGRTTI